MIRSSQFEKFQVLGLIRWGIAAFLILPASGWAGADPIPSPVSQEVRAEVPVASVRPGSEAGPVSLSQDPLAEGPLSSVQTANLENEDPDADLLKQPKLTVAEATALLRPVLSDFFGFQPYEVVGSHTYDFDRLVAQGHIQIQVDDRRLEATVLLDAAVPNAHLYENLLNPLGAVALPAQLKVTFKGGESKREIKEITFATPQPLNQFYEVKFKKGLLDEVKIYEGAQKKGPALNTIRYTVDPNGWRITAKILYSAKTKPEGVESRDVVMVRWLDQRYYIDIIQEYGRHGQLLAYHGVIHAGQLQQGVDRDYYVRQEAFLIRTMDPAGNMLADSAFPWYRYHPLGQIYQGRFIPQGGPAQSIAFYYFDDLLDQIRILLQ